MGIKPITGTCSDDTVLVDKAIGTAFPVVRHVAEHIEYIKHVSAHLAEIYRLVGSIDAVDDLAAQADNFELVPLVASHITALLEIHSNLGNLLQLQENISDIDEVYEATVVNRNQTDLDAEATAADRAQINLDKAATLAAATLATSVIPGGGLANWVLTKASASDYHYAWAAPTGMIVATYDPTNKASDAFNRSNHSGTQPATSITGLASIATSGSYSDLSGIPPHAQSVATLSGHISAVALKVALALTVSDITNMSANGRSLVMAANYSAMKALLIGPRIGTIVSSASPAPDSANHDQYNVTALAVNATIDGPSGIAVDGQRLIIRIKDNGVARTLAFHAVYRELGVTLPTTTVVSKTMMLGFIYNAADLKWDLVAKTVQV